MPAVFLRAGKIARKFVPARRIGRPAVVPQTQPMDIAQAIRSNLSALMAAAKDKKLNGPVGVLDLEADSGIGKTTIYRILSTEDPVDPLTIKIGTLSAIAQCYGLEAWQILVPNHLFDPLQPATVLSAADRQQIAIMRVVYDYVQRTAKGEAPYAPPNPGGEGPGDSGTGTHPGTKPKRPKAPRS